jgi:hypothetical protein
LPVIPTPVVKLITAAFVALFTINELPAWISSSSPPPPVTLTVRVVALLDLSVTAVLLVMRNTPTDVEAFTVMIAAAPAVVPAPSMIMTSVVCGDVRVLPLPLAAVFQLVPVLNSAPPATPIQK